MRVGILGGGQLGRMIALAGYPLGLRFRCLEPSREAPMGHLSALVLGHYDDPVALDRFAEGLDVITYEFENVPVQSARRLARHTPVYPPPDALEIAQDRLAEKRCFQELGIDTAPFARVDSRDDLEAAIDDVGLPAILKTRRFGYDGKGQAVIRDAGDVVAAWNALGGNHLVLEGFVAFRRELSVLAARGRPGEVVCYPLVQNEHRGGILRLSRAPAPDLAPGEQAEAERIVHAVLDRLEYVGLLAIELFELVGLDGRIRLLANEMAPRVHNSGHWTIEGARTSQFENHLRAVVGWPLGPTTPHGCSAMVNLIGRAPAEAAVLAIPGAYLHLYGKAPRPGRKVGHITVCAPDHAQLEALLARVRPLVADRDDPSAGPSLTA